MPTYSIKDKATQKIDRMFMSISEMEKYIATHPNKSLVLSCPAIVSGVSGLRKPDEGFRDILRNIKSKHRKSTIDV